MLTHHPLYIAFNLLLPQNLRNGGNPPPEITNLFAKLLQSEHSVL